MTWKSVQQVVVGVFCSSDLDIFGEGGSGCLWETDVRGARVKFTCHFQDNQKFIVTSLIFGFLFFSSVSYAQLQSKILSGKFWKEIVFTQFFL